VGYSSQSLAIYRMLTAEENLRFFGTLYGLTGARLRERVGWALEFAGLTARAQDRAGTFSGGMQRRLNLACSLLHEPDVLIMDEPTVGVDPQSRNLIFERVEELKQRGLTLIYTTHYMEEAARLCDRIAIMDQGRVLALDTLEMLIARHGGTPRVCFDVATDSPMPPVPPGWTLLGQRLEAPAPNPVETVQQAVQAGWTILGFQTQRPSLEDVFLNLTGRCLRD
jgi:ABC-2 type transport system ATP-binding protein